MTTAIRSAGALALASLLLTACGGRVGPDGGTGGGSGGAGGGAGGGGGTAVQPGAACRHDLQDCTGSGEVCQLMRVDGGPSGVEHYAERCFAGGCNLITQSPCSSSQQCGYDGGLRQCIPNGTLAENASCTPGTQECQRGLGCITYAWIGGGGRCSRFCNTHADCEQGKICFLGVDVPGSLEYPTVCALPPPACSPLLQDCPGSAPCEITRYPDGGFIAGCVYAGDRADGQACTPGNWCSKGSNCGRGTNYGTCAKFCNTDGGAPACTTGTCSALGGNLPGVGTCQ
jgi:hypothetical protein